MPIASRTFRIFVSSTFEDLVEERNALQREVFPVIRKLCEEHGARFQAIDLRWGVRDEAVLGQRMMETCLAEIERCQRTRIKPNFIVLLGDRYGRPPLPARVPQDEFEAVVRSADSEADRSLIESWYQRDDNAVPPEYLLKPRTGELVDAGRWREVEDPLGTALRKTARAAGLDSAALLKYVGSASHQEIVKGLGTTAEDRRHTLGFLRRTDRAKEPPELTALKGFLGKQLGENAVEYEVGEISNLCREITEKLSKVILDEMSRFESRTALELETEAHDALAQERSRHFTGRTSVLGAIADYLKRTDPRPLIVHGPSGSGKSAIMAKASEEHPGVRRFIGVTPASSNGLTLLRSLCEEIGLRYGQTGDLPATFNELIVLFQDRLKLASADRPLVVYLDALDQLNADDPAAAMDWMPRELPPHCRLVLSTIDIPARLTNAELVPVEPFSVEDAGSALDFWLADAKRTLQRDQRDKVLDSFRQTGLPLYLRLAFEEGRLWRSFDPPEKCTLGDGLAGIIDRLFARLSEPGNHGPVLVKQSLGFLAAARYGLTEDEMLDVLAADDEVWNDFEAARRHELPDGVRRLPVIVWSRLHLDIEPYLTERAVPGGTTISFYHRQLLEAVAKDNLFHEALAIYFSQQSNWLGAEQPNERRITELVHQQVAARLLNGFEATLTDFAFISAKCAAGLVFDLQEDYHIAIDAVPEATEHLRQESQRLATLRKWTESIVQCAREQCLPQPRDIIHSVRPWTNDQITNESKQVLEHPNRLDILRGFETFLEQEIQSLVEFGSRPGFVLQSAFNHAPAGPVHAASLQFSEQFTVPLFLRRWPRAATYSRRPALVRRLNGHGSVGLTADGRIAISLGPDDRTLHIWDLSTGLIMRRLTGHESSVHDVSITPDGKRAVSADRDRLCLWEVATGVCIRVITVHTGDKSVVHITPDGRFAASGGEVWKQTRDGGKRFKGFIARVWDLATGKSVRTWTDTGRVNCIRIMPDGRSVVTASDDQTVRILHVDTGRCLQVFRGHQGAVTSVDITPDGHRLISAGEDRTLRVWDVADGRETFVLSGHDDQVACVSIVPDGELAVSGSWDATIRLWDLTAGTCLRVLTGHAFAVLSTSITADGRGCLTGSDTGDPWLRYWDLCTGSEQSRTWRGRSGLEQRDSIEITSLNIMPSAREAITWSVWLGLIRVWNLDTGICDRTFELDGGNFYQINISASNRRAVFGGTTSVVSVVDIKPDAVHDSDKLQFIGRANTPGRPDTFPDATRGPVEDSLSFLLGLVPKNVKVMLNLLGLGGYATLRAMGGGNGQVTCVGMTPSGYRAISASTDKNLRVWDLKTCACLGVLAGHNDFIESVAISDNGDIAASGGWAGQLHIWNLRTNSCHLTIEAHSRWIPLTVGLCDHKVTGATLHYAVSRLYVGSDL